jgi:hypothetical protein
VTFVTFSSSCLCLRLRLFQLEVVRKLVELEIRKVRDEEPLRRRRQAMSCIVLVLVVVVDAVEGHCQVVHTRSVTSRTETTKATYP